MGRKLDLSGLTEEEAEHVLQVVHRDMRLRKKEKERLSEMKQELEEEGSKCTILSKQNKFNDHCCIRCCSPFTFLINTKRQCLDCKFNVCKSCRNYSKKEKAWICSACQKSRLLRTQSLEWYYNNVKSRFKRFGSAKVLKTLYRKHLAERGTLSDVTADKRIIFYRIKSILFSLRGVRSIQSDDIRARQHQRSLLQGYLNAAEVKERHSGAMTRIFKIR